MLPDGFKLIHKGSRFSIYQINKDELIKIVESTSPDAVSLSRLENEWNVLNDLHTQGNNRAVSREVYQGRSAIKLASIDGVTLEEHLESQKISINKLLEIGINILKQLISLHEIGYIHGRLNPNHIIISPGNLSASLIGHGNACKTLMGDDRTFSVEEFEITELKFIAPEQTGRTDQKPSFATDLYSLGAILYRGLTGQTPFDTDNPLEQVHAHIAKVPTQAHLVSDKVPIAISEILEKALQKNPSDRYTSASELYEDLCNCLRQLQSKEELGARMTSSMDGVRRFNFAQSLVGRKKESKVLRSIFRKVKNGSREVILIEGVSGVGKTALGKSIHDAVRESEGRFLEGSYDEFNRGIPYLGVTQCLRQFVTGLLTKDDTTLNYWRDRLNTGIGSIAGILINIVPELSLILEDKDKIPLSEGPEAKNQLEFAVRSFIQIVADRDHPMVLMVDDIQWADADSIELIESLLSDTRVSYFLLISTYRQNSLPAGHPILSKVNHLKRNLESDSIISLQNLEDKNIYELIEDKFDGSVEDVTQLIRLIYRITAGNALHVTQFLSALVKDHVLNYNNQSNTWTWRKEQIERLNLSGGLEELIAQRISKINSEVLDLLSIASCIGSTFSEALLIHKFPKSLSALINEAVNEGLIAEAKTDEKLKAKLYQFAHDRIREMAYDRLEKKDRARQHLNIARLLSGEYHSEDLDEHIFEIATQYNFGKECISSSEELHFAARSNLQAGIKAKKSGAFEPALNYLLEGISFLDENLWDQEYELCLDLYGNAAQLASLVGNYQELKELSKISDIKALSILDSKPIVIANINALMAQKKHRRALSLELEYLHRLGYRIPTKGNKVHALLGLVGIAIKMRGKNSNVLSRLPLNTNDREITALQILGNALITAYFVEPDLLTKIIYRMLSISLDYGNASESAAGYMGYGFILSGVLGAFESGNDYGDLISKILSDAGRDELLYVLLFQSNIFLRHWKLPISDVISNLDICYEKLLNLGVFESAAYSIHSFIYFSFFQSVDLHYLSKRCNDAVAVVSTLNQPNTLHRIQMYHQAVINLTANIDQPHLLKGEAYDEEKMIPLHYEDDISIAIHNVHFLKAYLAFLFNNYDVAWEEIEKAKRFNEAAAASFFVPLFDYLCALIKLAQKENPRRIRGHLKKLKKYAESAPFNYQRYYILVKAEYSKSLNQIAEARVLYDDAIYLARQAGNLLDEALGWELAGRFYHEIDRDDKASTCFQYAYDIHLKWGAISKANQIIKSYKQTMRLARTISVGTEVNDAQVHQTFDQLSMVKSLQALTTELDLDRLLEKMMSILIENVGAERGMLILQKDNEWDIVAERDINNEKVKVLKGRKLDSPEQKNKGGLIPAGLVHYVIRTKRTVVINDVQRDIQFKDLPYLKTRKPRSVLCKPLINHKNLIGIVYLENTLTTGAFTLRIQEGLNLLSKQLAISLENAILYEDLNDKVIQNQNLVSKLQIKVEEQEKTLKTFSQFVPGPIVRKTLESKTELSMLEGELREVAVMFCDIRNFTSISEELEPVLVVDLLNEFYAIMTEIVQKYEGTVTNFIGDEIMAAFGVPVSIKRFEENAVFCAIEMAASVDQINEKYKKKINRNIRVGIGINSGFVVAGILGSKAKLAYSIIGDSVNTAKRIESLTKNLDNGILISEQIYKKTQKRIEVKAWDPILVKGKKEKLAVYEVLGRKT